MKHTPSVAIIRGKFLNRYEMQSFVPLMDRFALTAFGSMTPFHDRFPFPVVKLPSPMDLPEFPFKMPILNRAFRDAHYLVGLERALSGFDLVHTAETYYRYTEQSLDAKRRGLVKKVVATVLENIPHNNEGIWGRPAMKARARRELDHIIALTNLTRDALLAEGADPERITVIGHGIDTRVFQPDRRGRERHRPGKPLTVLFTGRLEEYKGVFTILEAAHILFRDKHMVGRLSFVFVGDGSGRNRMERFEEQNGLTPYVRHTSAVYDAMPAVYRTADIFVAPSIGTRTWKEQYCTALLEAQASGLPIVTTASGGIPENVGDAALIVREGDAGALALAIRRFAESPRLRSLYAVRARSRAERVHDARRIADRYAAVYERVLAGR